MQVMFFTLWALQVNMLRYLGIIKRPHRKPKCPPMMFTSGQAVSKKQPGWALAETSAGLKLQQFIVAVDSVVQSIGAAPSSVSDYVVKARGLKIIKILKLTNSFFKGMIA